MIRITAVMTREWPREWEQSLRTVSPVSSSHSWLFPKWEHVVGKVKGRWLDRSRWVLYQMQPAWAIPDELRRMLEDTPPRLLPPGRAFARRMFVDDWAHEIYRTLRCFPRPCWVIQGRQGGNPAGYSERESMILKAAGEPTDPPPVGALPYADFDWRVIEQILMRDRLLQADMALDSIVSPARITQQYLADQASAVRAFRSEFLNWFKGTLAPSADFLTWYTRRSESDMTLRQATRREMREARDFEALFLDTGIVPAA